MRGKAGASDGSMIGVDIGAKRTQVILLRRAEGTISLEKAASFPTSPEATTAGEFTNGLVVAEQLEEIWSGFDVKTSRVAVAVSGDRIFCQTHRPTADSAEQIESALRSEVESVAPYALKAATLDYDFVSGPGWGSTVVGLRANRASRVGARGD